MYQSFTSKMKGSTINENYTRKASQIDFLNIEEMHIPRKIRSAEMMKYYTPSWLAVIGLIASALASLQLPLFGLLLSKMFFVIMLPYDDPDFLETRNFWLLMFGILTIGMFTSSFI